MTQEQYIRAKGIQEDIQTLDAEINIMRDHIWQQERGKKDNRPYNIFRLSKLLEKPNKKTYKGLWCKENIDSIQSIIILEADEIQVLIQCKERKLEKLKEELKLL